MRDEPLEDAFSRGDAAAYEAAYRRFGARMYTTALRLLREEGAARECVHDVLLHLWRRKSAYATMRGSLEAFLVTCVRNQALSRVRNEARRREIAATLEPPGAYAIEDDPIERDRIERAVSSLSPEQTEVIRLAYYRGLTLAEAAAELRLPLGTIKGRLSAALRALRLVLVPEGR
ncbi:MAG: sigma-70 family RNA polymerase sigma factor [Candidatus Eremiobacteraeota bacterium]|nr:sigma-70 family RNA polymerase sigma factor [Candidatus Eremiobacteraeota bacterium]